MSKKLSFIPIVVVVIFLAMPWKVHAKKMGTESGGGGGVAWVGLKYPVLMDYFTIYKSVDELPVTNKEASRIDTDGDSSFFIKDNSEEIYNRNPAFSNAYNILKKWQQMPYDVMSFSVAISMSSPKWTFTEKELQAPPFYKAVTLPEDAQIEVAAYYQNNQESKLIEVQISKRIWNQMQLNDQTGLVLHESLRHLQLGFRNGYEDETLQRVTAIYLSCKPNGRLNYYMYYLLNNSVAVADDIYGSFDGVITKSCERLK